ncbi:MAG: protein kinase [Acidobacteria bacterium]|nr:protein kinase [Acidobacteriota bacterium]
MLGSTVNHYRITEKLGEGGGGAVYKAEDTKLNRTVVIKTLAPDLARDTAGRHRFLREARLASSLDHPGICTIYDINEVDGIYFIAMQFAEGRTLKEIISRKPLDLKTSLTIAIQLADALVCAHERGIIHRDIKPANVMVSSSSQCKILDFGLAKDAASLPATSDELTAHGALLGTPSYMSPEQARGEPLDHRTDIFSLGAVMYEMMTGERAFKGKSRIDILHAVLTVTPTPMRLYNPAIPAFVERIVERALAKKLHDRYPTMRPLEENLKRAMRQHLQETGSIPGEASAELSPPQHLERSWFKSSRVGRMLSRFSRRTPPRPAGGPHSDASAPTSGIVTSGGSWQTKERRTLAILPFKNLGGDPEADFYGFSLADSVITELARLHALNVTPSSYVARYEHRDVDPRQAGRELSVDAVLVSGFLKAGGRFRVTPQLVDMATGEILWTEKIDVTYGDIITLQDEISRSIVEGLEVKLTRKEEDRLGRTPTSSPEAYEFFLRGKNLLLKSTFQTYRKEDLDEAVTLFRHAIEVDPVFGLAYSALGRCYTNYVIRGIGGSSYYAEGRKALERALELEPQELEPRLFLVYSYLANGEKERARSVIRNLLKRAPLDHSVHAVAANLYRWDGLLDKALREYETRIELYPQAAPEGYTGRGRVFIYQGRYEQARVEFERGLALEPLHSALRTYLAEALYYLGDLARAIELLRAVLASNPSYQSAHFFLAWCLTRQDKAEEARTLIDPPVRDHAMADGDAAYWMASHHVLLGERDAALEWMKRAVHLGNQNYPWFVQDPNWKSLRDDAEYQGLIEEIRTGWQGLADTQ